MLGWSRSNLEVGLCKFTTNKQNLIYSDPTYINMEHVYDIFPVFIEIFC